MASNIRNYIDQNREEASIRAADDAADILGRTSTNWVLADNSVSSVSLDELKEALGKAMDAQASLWFE